MRSLTKILLLTTLFISACTSKTEDKSNDVETKSSRQLNLAIWGGYISPQLLETFTQKTGIVVQQANYSSNEELLAKVISRNSGIDMAVPSDYMVGIMAKLDLLHPLDTSLIPNKSLVLEQFLNPPYDPGNQFSLPYAWSMSGIAYHKSLVPKGVKSWKDVFSNPDYAGKVSMLDDVREVVGVALKVNGQSVNSTKPADLKIAQEFLKSIKPKVKMFRSDTVQILVDKEIAMAHAYSSSAMIARKKSGGQIEFVVPAEGGIKSIDNMVVFKDAKNVKEAFELINFLLTPEAGLEFVQTIFGGPVVKGVKEKLPSDLQKSQALFPTPEVYSKMESLVDIGEGSRAYDELWTQMKVE